MKTMFKAAAGVAVVMAVTGCSALSMGEEEFSCPGQPKGVLCVGPTEAYELTHTRDSLEDMMVDPDSHDCLEGECRPNSGKAAEADEDGAAPDATSDAAVGAAVVTGTGGMTYTYAPRSEDRQYADSLEEATVVAQASDVGGVPASGKAGTEREQLRQYSTAPLVEAPEPLAVLKAPEVMRILVAAWEDDRGDLNMPGYVYVELNPRQWITGHQANARPSRVVPFQVIQDAASTEQQRKAAAAGVDGLGVIKPKE